MHSYSIFETDVFSEGVLSLGTDAKRIRAKQLSFVYPQLKENPYFGKNIKKLKGYHPDTWRYRIGQYRFFYEIDESEKVVYMTVAEHRKECY